MRPLRLHEQISAVFEATGWSLQDLLDKSGIEIERSSLWRKLRGDLPMKTEEAESIVTTLRKHGFTIRVTWPPRSRNAA